MKEDGPDDSERPASVSPETNAPTLPIETQRARSWLGWLVAVVGVLLLGMLCIFYLAYTIYSRDPTEGVSAHAQSDIRVLEIGLIRLRTSTGSMPSSLDDLVRRPLDAKSNWHPLVQESALTDPWKQPYQYRNPGVHHPTGYDLFSKGPDMIEDTADDIGNW